MMALHQQSAIAALGAVLVQKFLQSPVKAQRQFLFQPGFQFEKQPHHSSPPHSVQAYPTSHTT